MAARRLVRGLELAGLAIVIGGLVLERLSLPAAASNTRRRTRASAACSPPASWCCWARDVRRPGARGQTVSRAPLATASPAIPQLVTHTHFGASWPPGVAMLGLALILSLARAPGPRALPARRARRRADVLAHRSRRRLGRSDGECRGRLGRTPSPHRPGPAGCWRSPSSVLRRGSGGGQASRLARRCSLRAFPAWRAGACSSCSQRRLQRLDTAGRSLAPVDDGCTAACWSARC